MTARALIVTLLLALPATGIAQPPRVPERARLEGEIRRGFARAVRERVGLSEDQMRRLAPVSRKHEETRRELQLEERRVRVALQGELLSASPDTTAVARHLGALREVYRRRVQLMDTEQRELGAIMNPVQLARFLALQEQVRRRMEQMRQGPPAGAAGPPGRRARPPG